MANPDNSRYVWVYLPTAKDRDRWHEMAKKSQTSVSSWVFAVVEEALAEKNGMRPRGELVKAMASLEEENKALREDLKLKNVVIDRYEEELRRLRAAPFQGETFKGMRAYSSELVDLLKTRGQIDGYSILDALGIGPKETEAIKAINRQLEELEAFGFIEAMGRGWQWKG